MNETVKSQQKELWDKWSTDEANHKLTTVLIADERAVGITETHYCIYGR